MAKQKGREMILEIWSGSAFVAIAGLKTKGLEMTNALVDVTTPNPATPGDRLEEELWEGIHSKTISADGIFEDDTAFGLLEAVALAATPSEQFRLTVPSFATYTGSFFVENLQFTGEMEGALTASFTLRGNGTITRAAI